MRRLWRTYISGKKEQQECRVAEKGEEEIIQLEEETATVDEHELSEAQEDSGFENNESGI